MDLKYGFIFAICISLMGCQFRHSNYAVQRATSPIPYKNLYSEDDGDAYEFHSTLYSPEDDRGYPNRVTITHLNDVFNFNSSTPEETWKSSKLEFVFSADSGIQIVPESISVEHYSLKGGLIRPFKIETSVPRCVEHTRCYGHVQLYYSEKMPKELTENVSFSVIKDGERRKFSYTINLVYRYDYSVWDIAQGV